MLLLQRRSRRPYSTFSSLQLRCPAELRANAQWNTSASSEVTERLMFDSYCVVPDALPVEYLTRLRHEMETLHKSGHLWPNATHILQKATQTNTSDTTTKTLLLEKRDIWEIELALLDQIRDTTAATPFLNDFDDQQVVSTKLRHVLPTWLGLSGQMIKGQYNAGQGACFPLHFDTYGDDGKCVTAVLYLNQGWEPQHGGELVLYPLVVPRSRVVVQPQLGTLVLFSSQQMLHRVIPAFQPRYALTTWLYHSPGPRFKAESDAFYRHCHHRSRAANAAAVERVSSDKENVLFRSMVTKLLRSAPFRRHLLKLMHEQEWTQSLRDSHVHTEAFGQYMATHEHELQVIEAATSQVLDTFRAKDGGKTSRLPRTKEELMHRVTDKDSQKFLQSLQLHWF